MRKFSIFLFAGFLSFAAINFALAGKSSPPEAFVENLSKVAIETLSIRDIQQSERNHRFRVLLNQNFDVPTIARFALGRYWRIASTEQQQEYMRLFENVIVGTYSARFSKYSGQKIQVLGSKTEIDSTIVNSRLINPDGSEPVKIDWRLKPDGGNFKITDLIVEGVSLSTTQRSEYASVIERNGGEIESLLKILRKKGAIFESDSDQKSASGN